MRKIQVACESVLPEAAVGAWPAFVDESDEVPAMPHGPERRSGWSDRASILARTAPVNATGFAGSITRKGRNSHCADIGQRFVAKAPEFFVSWITQSL
jgi:hypothetical protein